MAKFIDKFMNASVSRRGFLKGTAAATAAIAGLSLAGCQNVAETSDTTAAAGGGEAPENSGMEVSTEHSPIIDIEDGGQWISAACWHNCGGRCMNKVMIKDGMVVRQKTDDTHADSFDYPQQRGCVRGKAQQQQCFGADRLKYPMKRKNWSPKEPHGELRGRDEWEKISWEEAITYVADQFKKTKELYGNEAFLVASCVSQMSCKPLLAYGGHLSITDTASFGTYMLDTQTTIGVPFIDAGSGNDRMDMLNAETILLYASNPVWSAAGTPSYHYIRAKEAGAKFITVDPIYTETAQMLDAYWVPVRTGTDTALLLGVASEMIRLDQEEGNIVDWDFLYKYTVGFDAEHKTAGLKEDVNFLDYLNGVYDGVPKTAEWASEICGTPVEKITYLAREIGKTHDVWMMHNFAAARNNGAENLPQIFMTVAAMGGHMGRPGNCTSSNYHANAGNTGPVLVNAGGSGLPVIGNAITQVIQAPLAWEACLTRKYHDAGDPYIFGVQPGKEATCDVHCIVYDESAFLQTGPNMKRGIEAHRKTDFVVSKAQFLTTNAKYADIVLPVATQWEVPGGVVASNREFVVCYSQVTKPLYESKTDQEIDSLLIEALGLDVSEVFPISEKQQFFNQIAGCTVVTEDGSGYEPLVTITTDDIAEWDVEGKPQEGRIALQDFIDQGGYQVERKVGDIFSNYIGYEAFIADPEANPLGTQSGKFEICSQAKVDLLQSRGFSERTYKAYPEYIVPELGYETTFKGGKIGSEKGDYPYLLFNPHYIRRSHSVFDNCPWLREAWPNPVFLNASDAKGKGIQTGDTVLVWTKSGKVLRKACVMETMMPGHVALPHGAWSNIDEETEIDHGGADNYLLGPECFGCGVSGYNNFNCNYEKYDGPELVDDCYVPARIMDLD